MKVILDITNPIKKVAEEINLSGNFNLEANSYMRIQKNYVVYPNVCCTFFRSMGCR
jgi:hypothetical protein